LFSGQQTKIHSKVLATAQTFETLMCNPLWNRHVTFQLTCWVDYFQWK
jgi:hypothetical protein